MKNIFITLFFLFSINFLNAQIIAYPDDEAVVVFDENISQSEINAILDDVNMYVAKGPTTHTNAFLLKFTSEGPPSWWSQYTNTNSPINGVVKNLTYKPKTTGSGFNYFIINPIITGSGSSSTCQGLLNPNTQSNGGEDVDVAIFDTGIANLPEVLTNFYDTNDLGFNLFNLMAAPVDDNDHGTHISTIITNNLENGNSAINLRSLKTHDFNGLGNLFDIIKGLDMCIDIGIDIVNMSFSFPADQEHKTDLYAPLRVAIDVAKDEGGILVIVSAGNDNVNNDDPNNLENKSAFPSSYPNDNIVSVASVNCSMQKTPWSNYGVETVDLMAPGEDIFGYDKVGNAIILSGTSQSTALVTQTAAYLASFQETFDWELTKCALLTGVVPLQGTQYVSSNGFINPQSALQVLQANPPCDSGNNNQNLVNQPSNTLYKLNVKQIEENTTFEIKSSKAMVSEIQVRDISGLLVYSNTVKLKEGISIYDLNLNVLTTHGMYFLSVINEEEISTVKFAY